MVLILLLILSLAGCAEPKTFSYKNTCEHLQTPIQVFHKGTGHIAMYTHCKWETGQDSLLSKDVVWPDGSRPVQGERLKCGTCGKYISFSRADLEF